MPLQLNGPISVTDIITEFDSRLPEEISNLQNASMTGLVNPITDVLGKIAGETISFSDFYGLSNYRIILPTNSFDVITTYSTTIPVASILAGSVDEWSGNLDPLTLISVQSPINGTVVLNGTNVEFTSTSGTLGSNAASFSFTVRNSSNENESGTVSMNVLAIPPIITIPDVLSLRQGETLLTASSALSDNDIDGQGRSLTVTGVSNPIGGAVSLNSGTIEFISTGLSGQPASFDYTVTNGTETATGIAYITITPLPEKYAYIFAEDAAADVATTIQAPPTQEDIFNSWDRFDGSGYYPGGTTPGGQAADWQLAQNPLRIVQPTNTSLGGGFVSPELYNDYVFEATVRSDAQSDDDTIGLIAAFARDGSTNKTLAAVRTKGGQSPSNHWGVFYTENGPWNPTWLIASSDMSAGSTSSNQWWPDQSRIQIQRRGDIIKFYTTNWNDVDNYQISSEIIVDLSSDPRLAVFMGDSPYGYYSHSQGGSTYFDVDFDGGIDGETIFSAETSSVYLWNGAGWDLSTGPDRLTVQDKIGYVRKVEHPDTGERFIVKETEIEYLGTLTAMSNIDSVKILNETQNVVINTSTSTVGSSDGARVVGLYQKGVEETNLMSGKPELLTSGIWDSGSKNHSLSDNQYFSNNNIDINTLQLVNGVVVFSDGIVGKITNIAADTITYFPSDDFKLWDETI